MHGGRQQRSLRPLPDQDGCRRKSETRSLASEDEIFTVDIDKAKELFSQPKYGRGRGRGAAKPPLRDLGKDPNTGKNVTIKDGRFGAYITDGETNRTVPRQYTPESITLMTPSDCSPKSVRLVPPPVAVAVLGVLVAPRPLPARARRAVPRCGFGAGAKRAERRAEVKKLANKGWSNQRIAEKLGSTPPL